MIVLSKEEFLLKRDLYRKMIEDGAVFIHPTDTIYGLGCDARNSEAIKKIRDIKNRKDQPLSVIVPSKDWILENCLTTGEIADSLDKLPGAYTFLLNIDKKLAVSENVNPNEDSIGVRIPDNWFSKEVEFFGFPVISTSVNKQGNEFMTSIDDLDPEIKGLVDFIIYEGEKKGNSSHIIDYRFEDLEEEK
ncbi:MAG: L-threonylcarbamoyladenylate synthase [Candidatus Woesearchaeota archaeon]